MTGWLIFLLLAGIVLLLLWRLGRLDRAGVMMVLSALFVAAAGYAWQGAPGVPGAPFVPVEQHGLKPDTLFAREHPQFLGRFGATPTYLNEADAMNRIGEDRAAVTVLQTAISKYPRDPDLRIGLSHALFIQAGFTTAPAVTLALEQAQAIAPSDPAPRYFRGLMAIEGGDLAGAEREWRGLYASLPADSPWRAPLETRLHFLDTLRAQIGGAPAAAR
ncbi:MAG TPA: cytochrome C biogenesis protein [Sphingomonas sp.]